MFNCIFKACISLDYVKFSKLLYNIMYSGGQDTGAELNLDEFR